MSNISESSRHLYLELKDLIAQSKKEAAISVNATLTKLYWEVGCRINQDILKNQRAEYGKTIVAQLSQQLTKTLGKGWGEKQLRQCMQFASSFTNKQIVYTLCIELSWSHIRLLIPIKDNTKRSFYIQMCIYEKWSVRTFKDRIKSMLYERTAISKKPEKTILADLKALGEEKIITPDLVFKDPYVLDFLELKDTYSEKDLENSILIELQNFIIELGTDFAFLSRQKRITIDDRDYYIDLLFYHRKLKSLVAVELKIGEFEAAHKGQMELYLAYLQKYEKLDDENSPLGIILCTGKNEEHIELMSLEKNNIKVAEYLTLLPSQDVLQDKLHRAVEIAHQKMNKS